MNGPNPLASVGLMIGVAATLFLAVRLCQRYGDNLRAAGRQGGARFPQASWGTWALLVGLIAGFLHEQPGTLRYRLRDVSSPGNMSMPPWLVPTLLGAILLLSLGAYLRAALHPGCRIARLIGHGRFNKAEALIRRRLARRHAQHGPSAAPENPYAAPAALSLVADPQAEAEDWNNLGLIAMNRRDWPEAIGCFERAEGIGVLEKFILQNNRGLALIAVGQIDEGTAVVEQAIAESPSDQVATRPLLRLNLAGRLIDAGRFDRARSSLDRAEADQKQTQQTGRSAAREFAARVAAARARLVESQDVGGSEGPTLGRPSS